MTSSRTDRRVAALLFVAFVVLYTATGRVILDSTDGEKMLQNAEGLLHGRLTVESDISRESRPSLGPDGREYSPFGIGQPVLAIPFYLAGVLASKVVPGLPERFAVRACVMQFCPVVLALTCALLFLILRRLELSGPGALTGSLVFGLATLAWPYSKTFFSDPLSGLLVLIVAWNTHLACSESDPKAARVAGFAAAAGILVRHFNILVAGLAGLFLVISALRGPDPWRQLGRQMLAYLPAVTVGMIFWGWHNWVRYGGVTITAGTEFERFGATPLWLGVVGLLVSPGKGLLWYSPVVVLAPAGFARLSRPRPGLPLVLVAFIALHVCLYATLTHWGGHWSWGPRFLVSILPLLALGTAITLAGWPGWSRTRRLGAGLLIALSVAVQVLGCSVYFTHTHHRLRDAGFEPQFHNFQWDCSPLLWQARALGEVQWSPLNLSDAKGGMPSADFKRSLRATLDYWPAYAHRFGIPWPVLLFFPLQLLAAAWLIILAARQCRRCDDPGSPPGSPPG